MLHARPTLRDCPPPPLRTLTNLIIVLAYTGRVRDTRIVRSQAPAVREREFVEAAPLKAVVRKGGQRRNITGRPYSYL